MNAPEPRPVSLRDVLEDALVQVENLSTPEDANYVLARIRAHCDTANGRLEVANLIGHAEHADVSTVPTEGGDWANEVVIRANDMVGLELTQGETVLVIGQRRWEP